MKRILQRQHLAVLLGAACMASWGVPALAEVQYSFSGFGTLGAAVTNNDNTGFRQNVDQYSGADESLSFGVDSRVAVQGSVSYNDFALTAQVLANRRDGEDFKAGFEWLYAQYSGISGLDLKAGRVVLPSFMVSDSRHVGFAVPWVRVPPLIYGMMPLSHIDGVQATYRHSIGAAVLSGQVTHGDSKGKARNASLLSVPVAGNLLATADIDSKSDDIWGLSASLAWGDWTVRLAQVTTDISLKMKVAVPQFVLPSPYDVAPELAQVRALSGATLLQTRAFKDTFRELGVQYDDGKLMVMAEYVTRDTDTKIQVANGWYVGGGYRIGQVMPYAVISQFEVTKSTEGAIPPKSTGVALGARYDLRDNLALKGEWAQYRNNSSYIFTDSASPGVADKKVNVVSVVLDFIF